MLKHEFSPGCSGNQWWTSLLQGCFRWRFWCWSNPSCCKGVWYISSRRILTLRPWVKLHSLQFLSFIMYSWDLPLWSHWKVLLMFSYIEIEYIFCKWVSLVVLMRSSWLYAFFCRHLSSEWEATRIEALHWISALLDKHRVEVPP